MKKWPVIVCLLAAAPCLPAFAQDVKPPPKADKVVKGVVVDKNGKPVSTAKVYYRGYGFTVGKQNNALIPVDKRGRFSQKVDRSDFIFLAAAPGYSNGSVYSFSVTNGEYKIVLYPEFKVKGKVLDESGKPVEGVKVECDGCEGQDGSQINICSIGVPGAPISAVSAKDGSFTLRHLPDIRQFRWGTCQISTSKKNRANWQTVVNNEDFTGELVLKSPVGCSVEGTVSLPDKSIPAGKVYRVIIEADINKWNWQQPTYCFLDDKGHFTANNLLPGKTTIRAEQFLRPDKSGAFKLVDYVMAPMSIVLSSQKVTTVDLPMTAGCVAEGVLTDKESKKPLEGAFVYVLMKESVSPLFSARSDKDGKFAIRVPPGKINFNVECEGRYRSTTAPDYSFDAVDGQDKKDAEIVIDRSASLDDYDQSAFKPLSPDFEMTPGTYDLIWDPDLACGECYRMPCVRWDSAAASSYKNKPALVSKKPRYWIYHLDSMGGTGEVGVLLDESRGTDTGYDTCYIDTNRNWDFTDEKPLKMPWWKEYDQVFTDWVQVASQQGKPEGQHTDHPVTVRLGAMWSGQHAEVAEGFLYANGGYKGTIDTPKGKVQCALIDCQTNGVFNDMVPRGADFLAERISDCLFVDSNSSGKLAIFPFSRQRIALDPICQVGKKIYVIKPSEIGDKLSIALYNGPMGLLKIKASDLAGMDGAALACTAISKNGEFSTETTIARPLQMPAGEYRIKSANFRLVKGSNGLNVSISTDTPIRVQANKCASLNVSGKLECSIMPPVGSLKWKSGQATGVGVLIRAGNVKIDSIGDTSLRYLPKVKLFDKKGKLAGTAKTGFT